MARDLFKGEYKMSFASYPKVMKHKDHQPPEWKTYGEGKGINAPEAVMTRPEILPDITVGNLDDEKRYAARGYRPTNMANADEYEAAMLEQSHPDGYVFEAYPKWKYHPVFPARIIKSEQDDLELGEGWFDYPVEATEADLLKYQPEEIKPEVNEQKPDDEASKLAAERAAFEAEKAAFLAEKEKSQIGQQSEHNSQVPQTGVDRHGLKPGKQDKRSRQ
jgi:hypothetical protein